MDEGGPLREFFHLLIYEIGRNNALFSGDGNRRVPRHSIIDLENNLFFTVGKVFALSLMHGGPGPSFLAKSVVQYLLFGITEGDILDVPEICIKDSLLKVSCWTEVLCGTSCLHQEYALLTGRFGRKQFIAVLHPEKKFFLL